MVTTAVRSVLKLWVIIRIIVLVIKLLKRIKLLKKKRIASHSYFNSTNDRIIRVKKKIITRDFQIIIHETKKGDQMTSFFYDG